MFCVGCERVVHDWFGDPFCDFCGGVMSRPGFLLCRHVATVEGVGGRLPIVWDESISNYKFRYPYTPKPSEKMKRAGIDGFDFSFRTSGFLSAHGPLDAVLALALPWARGDGQEVELSLAPTSTPEEKALLGV